MLGAPDFFHHYLCASQQQAKNEKLKFEGKSRTRTKGSQ